MGLKKKTCMCRFTKKALVITLYNSLGALLRWVGETHPNANQLKKNELKTIWFNLVLSKG
jgi:hypothetical protein